MILPISSTDLRSVTVQGQIVAKSSPSLNFGLVTLELRHNVASEKVNTQLTRRQRQVLCWYRSGRYAADWACERRHSKLTLCTRFDRRQRILRTAIAGGPQ